METKLVGGEYPHLGREQRAKEAERHRQRSFGK